MPRLSIDLFSSLPGILVSFGHFVHRKRATSEHLAESHEQPVQCMIRGDLKNMEYNWPPIHHMYRPFLLVVHFISSCIFGSSKKSVYHLHFGLLTKISIFAWKLDISNYVVLLHDNRWVKRILHWNPRGGRLGRSFCQWQIPIQHFCRWHPLGHWLDIARNIDLWF